MFPKTEKELEIYFKLKDVEDARSRRHVRPYGTGSSRYDEIHYELEYQRIKEEYLKLINE